jgi:hypothetical protein
MEPSPGKPTLADIKATYTEKKRAFDRENLYVYAVMRPLSWIPTWLCLRLGISANGATWIGLVIGLASCAAFAAGGYRGFLAGALLYNLFFLFDHIDGNIARFKRKTNHYGKFIDGVFGAVLVMLLLLSIGIGMQRGLADAMHDLGSTMAFAAASAIIFRFYIALRLEFAFHQAEARPAPGGQSAPPAGEAAADRDSGGARSRLGRVKGALLRLEQSTLEGSLLIFAAAGRFEWWIWLYGPLLMLNCALEILRSLTLAGKRLNVYRPF